MNIREFAYVYVYMFYSMSTAPDPQWSGRVDILTHPYTAAAYASGVVTGIDCW